MRILASILMCVLLLTGCNTNESIVAYKTIEENEITLTTSVSKKITDDAELKIKISSDNNDIHNWHTLEPKTLLLNLEVENNNIRHVILVSNIKTQPLLYSNSNEVLNTKIVNNHEENFRTMQT